MLTTGKKKLVGMGALASNVATSVLMVFVNKMLMDASGYAFSFGRLAETFSKFSAFCRPGKACDTCN